MTSDPRVGSARIAPVTEPDQELAAALAKTLSDARGVPLNIFATLAHHPRLLKRSNVLGGMFLAHGELAARDRELAVLRIAWRTRSEYEWGQHVLIGTRAGLTSAEITALTASIAEAEWSSRDIVLLSFVDEILKQADVTEETWQAARRFWSDVQLIELTMLVGFYRMIAGFLNTVRVEREDDLPGWPSGAVPQ